MGTKMLERYSAAVNSDDLTVNERTTWSDTDVLGAAGLAGRHNPLGLALTRLFADGKPEAVLLELTELAFKRARTLRTKIDRDQSKEVATAVLGWYRFGACQPCGGTGYSVIKGTPVQGDECPHCRASGKIPFDLQFPDETRALASWLSGEIDRAQAAAGSDAMKALAPRLDLG
jgi:hypothetical protein